MKGIRRHAVERPDSYARAILKGDGKATLEMILGLTEGVVTMASQVKVGSIRMILHYMFVCILRFIPGFIP